MLFLPQIVSKTSIAHGNVFYEQRRLFATEERAIRPGRRRRLRKTATGQTQTSATSTAGSRDSQKEHNEFIERLYRPSTDPKATHTDTATLRSSRNLFLTLRKLLNFRGPFALRDPQTLQEVMQILFQNREYVKAIAAFEKAHSEARMSSFAQKLYFDALVEAQNSGQLSLFEHFAQKAQKGESFFIFGQLGSSPSSPIYVVQKRDWLSLIFTVLLYIIFVALLLWLLSRSGSGGVGKILSRKFSPVERSNVRFSDVKGNEEAVEEMRDIVDYLKNPKKYLELGVKVPKGVLLIGPPGTGKTLLARAVAGEAGCSFIATSGSEFEEVFVGLGASRIRELFQTAKRQAPCIIFIDEVDAIGGRRDDLFGRYTRMSLNQLLNEIDGFEPSNGVIVMAATNMPDLLDPALIRPGRFDRKVQIELPDRRARKEIIEHYLRGRKGDDVDTDSLAGGTPGFSGADLENLVNWAAMEATKRNLTKVPQKLLEEALLNVAMGRERKSLAIDYETRRLCSFHESGHALVGLYTPGAQTIRLATLVPRSHSLGMVSFMDKDDLLKTKREFLAQIDTAMGGRVAEELIFGPEYVSQGAGSDLQQATKIARNMVYYLGMGQSLGMATYSPGEDGPEKLSPETADLAEHEVRKILDESYQRVKALLTERKNELHLLAEGLLKYETLTLDQIKLVVSGKPLKEIEDKLKSQKELQEQRQRDGSERKKPLEDQTKEGVKELRRILGATERDKIQYEDN